MKRHYLPSWLELSWAARGVQAGTNFTLPAGKRYMTYILDANSTRSQYIAKGYTQAGKLEDYSSAVQQGAAGAKRIFETLTFKGSPFLKNYGATGPGGQGMTLPDGSPDLAKFREAGNGIELGGLIMNEIGESDYALVATHPGYITMMRRLKERIDEFKNAYGYECWNLGNYGALDMYQPIYKLPMNDKPDAWDAKRTEMLGRYASRAAARAGITFYQMNFDEFMGSNVVSYQRSSQCHEQAYMVIHGLEIQKIASDVKTGVFKWPCIEWVGPPANQLQNGHFGWMHRVTSPAGFVQTFEHSVKSPVDEFVEAFMALWIGDCVIQWNQFSPNGGMRADKPNSFPINGYFSPQSKFFPDVPGQNFNWDNSGEAKYPEFPWYGYDFMQAGVQRYCESTTKTQGGVNAYGAIKVNNGAFTTPKVGEILYAGVERRGFANFKTKNNDTTCIYWNKYGVGNHNVTVKHPETGKEWTLDVQGDEPVIFEDSKLNT